MNWFLHSFAVVTCYGKIVLQILSVRVKILSSTNLVASRRVKRLKTSLPIVGVTQKHLFLKLPIITCILSTVGLQISFPFRKDIFPTILAR